MSLYDEGHTIAGWTGVAVATTGSAVAGWGVCAASAAGVAGGLVVVAASVLVTWVLHLTGWGKPPGVRPREQWSLRSRDTQAGDGHPGCVGCRLAGRGRRSAGRAAVPGRAAAEPATLPAAD
ncbi:HGxxPAAW family protein [Streptomyces sp. NPDC052292]|uniref:HGxxPAAW family protein n=1 Tax=Streptomyces sp. NPDC052292 TaxID=3155053 RepID=UPI00343C133F